MDRSDPDHVLSSVVDQVGGGTAAAVRPRAKPRLAGVDQSLSGDLWQGIVRMSDERMAQYPLGFSGPGWIFTDALPIPAPFVGGVPLFPYLLVPMTCVNRDSRLTWFTVLFVMPVVLGVAVAVCRLALAVMMRKLERAPELSREEITAICRKRLQILRKDQVWKPAILLGVPGILLLRFGPTPWLAQCGWILVWPVAASYMILGWNYLRYGRPATSVC